MAQLQPPIAMLNTLTSSDPAVFAQIQMPDVVRKKLCTNDFDDWDDVAATTMCSADVLREVQQAIWDAA